MEEGHLVARIALPKGNKGPFILAMEKILARSSRTLVVHPGVLEVEPQSLFSETYGLADFGREMKAQFMLIAGVSRATTPMTLLSFPRRFGS